MRERIAGTSQQQPRRRPVLRTKTGCLICRLRRKKCDEQKPSCAGCIRNGLICSWPSDVNGIPPKCGRQKQRHSNHQKYPLIVHNARDSANLNNGSSDNFKLDFNDTHVDEEIVCNQLLFPDPSSTSDRLSSISYGEPFVDSCFLELPPSEGNDVLFHGPRSFNCINQAIDPYISMALTLKALDHSGSRFLLQHYVQITAPRISGRVYPENPYITYILPLALSDDKIMQTVLAISGTHLMVHNPSVEHLMRSHYAVALRSVKHELTKYANGESSDVLKLLVTTLLLCQFECIDGKIHGELYHHLRASRELLLKLQKSKHPVDQNLHGFLLEQYAFLTIVAKITLRVDFQDREVAFDPLVFSLESINRDSNIYGTMFGCAHQLFELIPRISMLANQRLRENEEGISSFESIAQLRLLEDKIRSWDYSRDDSMRPEENYFALAGRIYQQAILAFLYTSFHGPKPPDADLLAKVEPCISDFLKFFLALPPNTSIWTTMMWPVITAGSCMRQPKQREYIFRALDKTPHLMFVCFRMKEILKWVWEDKSGESYGPYGIEMMMKRRNINICVG